MTTPPPAPAGAARVLRADEVADGADVTFCGVRGAWV